MEWWFPGTSIFPRPERLRARIESADVIHDFWVPDLARKMDAVPGRTGYIWLEADTPGTYAGTCSEFCGAQHAWMRFRVIADTESSFDAWLNRQAQPAPEPSGNRRGGRAVISNQEVCGVPWRYRNRSEFGQGPESGAPCHARVPGQRHRAQQRREPDALADRSTSR